MYTDPSGHMNVYEGGCGVSSSIKVLFLQSDLNLKPEVQQMISYYDDLYVYNYVAIDLGIIKDYEFKALKKACEEKLFSCI